MMQPETVFKVAFGVWAVLFIMPVARANRKAKLEHGSRIAQFANEYAPLLWVRVIVGVPIWAFLIDWLVSRGWFPWATVSVPLWARRGSWLDARRAASVHEPAYFLNMGYGLEF